MQTPFSHLRQGNFPISYIFPSEFDTTPVQKILFPGVALPAGARRNGSLQSWRWRLGV